MLTRHLPPLALLLLTLLSLAAAPPPTPADLRLLNEDTSPSPITRDKQPPVQFESALFAIDAHTRDILAARLKELIADQQPLERILNFIHDSMNLSISIDWTELKTLGIDRNAPVSVSLRDTSVADSLSAILERLSPGKLDFIVDQGTVAISTRKDLASPKYFRERSYDIRALLAAPPPSRAARIADLKKAILAQIAPASWRDSGGTVGTLREADGRLIVTQLPDAHVALHNFLEKYLADHCTRIFLDVRFFLAPPTLVEKLALPWTPRPASGNANAPAQIRSAPLEDTTYEKFQSAVQSEKIRPLIAPRVRSYDAVSVDVPLVYTPDPDKTGPRKFISAISPPATPVESTLTPLLALQFEPHLAPSQKSIDLPLRFTLTPLLKMETLPAPNQPNLKIENPLYAPAKTFTTTLTLPTGSTTLLDAGPIDDPSTPAVPSPSKKHLLILLRPHIALPP